jgi:hypothetical protein
MLPEATLIQLLFLRRLLFDEKVEETCVLGVDALTVTGNVAAEHFLVSIWTRLHGFSFLRRVSLLRTRLPERRTQGFSPLKEAAGSVTS